VNIPHEDCVLRPMLVVVGMCFPTRIAPIRAGGSGHTTKGATGMASKDKNNAPKAKRRKPKGLFRRGGQAVKGGMEGVQVAREKLSDATEVAALWIGVLGFVGVGVFL